MTRILWRIMPLAVACLVVSAIDRANIGFAKLGMLGDLGFSETVLAFGASLFYLGYVLFEIPSAMAGYRYGARLWFARSEEHTSELQSPMRISYAVFCLE